VLLGCFFLGQLVLSHLPIDFFMIIVRAKISNFSPTRLRNYLDQSVFLQGFLSFPPLIYLSVPAADCVFLEVPEGYDDIPIPDDCTSLEGTAGVMCDTTYYQCGAHLYSQFSICLLLSAFLGVRLFVAPLASASGLPSLGEIRVFDKLQLKIKFQIFLFSLVCTCNIILFKFAKSGPCRMGGFVLFCISIFGICLLALSEGVAIALDYSYSVAAASRAGDRGGPFLGSIIENLLHGIVGTYPMNHMVAHMSAETHGGEGGHCKGGTAGEIIETGLEVYLEKKH
jgi:hypothetical protein